MGAPVDAVYVLIVNKKKDIAHSEVKEPAWFKRNKAAAFNKLREL
jgi:hypothetical protein